MQTCRYLTYISLEIEVIGPRVFNLIHKWSQDEESLPFATRFRSATRPTTFAGNRLLRPPLQTHNEVILTLRRRLGITLYVAHHELLIRSDVREEVLLWRG